MDVQELHQKIIKKFGSIHNFCKINENLNRSTVYLVLAGKYAGNVQKQMAVIEKVLDNTGDIQKKVSIVTGGDKPRSGSEAETTLSASDSECAAGRCTERHLFEEQEISEVLQTAKCSNCRLLRPNCAECKRKNMIESSAIYNFIKTRL